MIGENNMEFMNNTLQKYIEELSQDNLFTRLDYEQKEKIEKLITNNIQEISKRFEGELGSSLVGVKFKLSDDIKFEMRAKLNNDGIYRGTIFCTRLLLIGMYQMFYQMDYKNIILDGKNIENVKKILFNLAIMCMAFHELAHIYKGHLQLYNQWTTDKEIEKNLDIQTLEWDADSYAATKIAEWISNINRTIIPQDKTDFAMKIACGAIHGMMYWQRTSADFDEIERKAHPPIFYREMAMLKCIGDLRNNFNDILGYITGYEKEFNRIRGVESSDIKKYFKHSREKMEYMSKIENNWEKIKSNLQNYSVFPLEEMETKDFL